MFKSINSEEVRIVELVAEIRKQLIWVKQIEKCHRSTSASIFPYINPLPLSEAVRK